MSSTPTMGSIVNSEGLRVKTYKWDASTLPQNPKGAIVLIHGITSHCCYEYLANESQSVYEKQWFDQRKRLTDMDWVKEPQNGTMKNGGEMNHGEDSGIRHCHFNESGDLIMSSQEPSKKFIQQEGKLKIQSIGIKDLPINKSSQLYYENSWVECFASNGFIVYGLDLPGHGKSEGWQGNRCCFHTFDSVAQTVLDYVEAVCNDVQKMSSLERLPLFVLGISFGGALVARFLQLVNPSLNITPPCVLSGVLLIAPALSLYTPMNYCLSPYFVWFPKFLCRVLPDFKAITKIHNPRYNYVNIFYNNDPLTYKQRLTLYTAGELLFATDLLQSNTSKNHPSIPLLLCHSVYDTLCRPQGSKIFFHNSPNKDKQLWLLYGMWHTVTKEAGSYALCQRLVEWCLHRC